MSCFDEERILPPTLRLKHRNKTPRQQDQRVDGAQSASQPRHPVECLGHRVVRKAVWDLVCGNHQGQRSHVPRK